MNLIDSNDSLIERVNICLPALQKKTIFSLSPRELTLREVEILKTDNKLIPNFWKNKFEKDCAKNWNIFYKRNRSNFFKDRHWITKEFSDLFDKSDEKKVIFEVGCGVGNTIFPLLEYNLNLSVHCCDFSPRAVEILKENALYDEQKVNAFVLDLTISPSRLTNFIAESSVDVVTMFFVLSAIPPLEMRKALQPIYQVLKPGGTVVFRDYGIYDHAMLRFKQGHKLSDNLYVRQDGTLAYYFSLEFLQELFSSQGFQVVSNEYLFTETINRKEKINVERVFVQSRFLKKKE